MNSLLVILAAAAGAAAGIAEQTDWSGGEWTQGICTQWSDMFKACGNVSWAAVPGQISLQAEPLSQCEETVVNESLPLAGLAAGDVNGDGLTDLAGASLVNGHLWWFENPGNGEWSSHELAGDFQGALGCCLADVDGDGNLDLLGATCEPDMIVVWMNDDGTGAFNDPVVIDPLFPGVHCVSSCFLDDDQYPDLMAAGNEIDELRVYYGSPGGSWEMKVIAEGFTGTQSVSPGDIDGDGDTDAAGAALEANQFAWWENPGNRSEPWTKRVVADSMAYAHHTVVVDMNSDGHQDILGTSFGNRRITWWENDGSPAPDWEPHTVAPGLTGALTGIPGDFDGDNDLDVAGAGWSSDRVLWYENLDGSGENWQTRTAALNFNGAWPLVAADLDNNGSLDLAAGADVLNGSGVSHGLSIFRLSSFRSSGWLESMVLDTQDSPEWASFEIEAEQNGEFLNVRWRSSDDPSDLGEWSEGYPSSSVLSGLIHRYVQYRVEMGSVNGNSSPVVKELLLGWDSQGVTAGSSVHGELFTPVPSPSSSGLDIHLDSDAVSAEVMICDLSGRVVYHRSGCAEGETLTAEGLLSGLYVIQVRSCGLEDLQRITVLN